ncbi:MAG TPA: hypothetical protein DDZ41_11130 [Flavobacterium sp.]|nr:hypothetical protein [Flavobacterium sp.]
MIAYGDLGLGATLVNIVSRFSKNSVTAEKKHICDNIVSVFFLLCTISIFLILILSFLKFLFIEDGYISIVWACLLVAFGIPLSLYQRILFGLQRSHLSNAWSTGGKLISLALIWLASKHLVSNPIGFLIILLGTPALINIIGSLHTIHTIKVDFEIKISNSRPDKVLIKKNLRTGLSYFVLQLVPFIEQGMDVAILSIYASSVEIATLDIHSKLFMYIPALVSVAAFPLWPAISKAYHEKDNVWANNIIRFAYFGTITVTIVLSSLFFINSEIIVTSWVKKELIISESVKLALSIFAVMSSISLIQSILLNAKNLVAFQAKFYITYIVILIIIKIFIGSLLGIQGIVWAGVVGISTRVVIMEIMSRRMLKLTNEK